MLRSHTQKNCLRRPALCSFTPSMTGTLLQAKVVKTTMSFLHQEREKERKRERDEAIWEGMLIAFVQGPLVLRSLKRCLT